MKLHEKYAQVRSNILMMSELPTINQAYRILMQEQKHQELQKIGMQQSENVALVTEKRKYVERGNKEDVASYSASQKNGG